MPAVTKCDGCGQQDDHPKWHYPPYTFHHDCVPAYVIEDATSVSNYAAELDEQGRVVGQTLVSRTAIPEKDWHPHVKRAMEARELALGGTRGDKLRKHLQAHKPVTDAEQAKHEKAVKALIGQED